MPESGRAREVVERLLKAEGQATARLAEADSHAQEHLEEAAREADRRRTQAGERAEREHEDALERARSEARAESATHVERTEVRWRRLADAVRPHVDVAAERVVAWVCGEDGGAEQAGEAGADPRGGEGEPP